MTGHRIVRALAGSLAASLAAMASPVAAQELRDFCPDRPGLGTPPCTIDKGHGVVEIGGVDWTRDDDGATRTDTIVAGDALLRYGLTDTLEVQLGWTAFGAVRERDRASGGVAQSDGTGDVVLAMRRNLANPDGSGLSIATMAYATAPTGGPAIGAGDWSAGVLIPVSYALSDAITLELTPQVSAEVDDDRDGRHLSYGSVMGVNVALGDTLDIEIEVQGTRDRDPDGHDTELLASLAFDWQPEDGLQLDVGAVAGLGADSPDFRLYVGIARRF